MIVDAAVAAAAGAAVRGTVTVRTAHGRAGEAACLAHCYLSSLVERWLALRRPLTLHRHTRAFFLQRHGSSRNTTY